MNTSIPSELTTNRINEESLQRTFEAMLTEIKRMKLDAGDKKKLIAMLIKYRTAWNSYINRVNPRQSRAELNSQRKKTP
ncbi:MAG: hypothetical protein HY033_02745 [Ignavibacteriae bacterium]|nr:hypothetical protein [Ignavibacteria bacterium]MBI3363806.1 hypothetical protein [Ignavibacteriota bacterium]